MGVVLNPIAYRVGYKYSWYDAWYSHRLTYSVFIHDVLAFKAVILFLFFRYFSYKRAYWLYSHLNVYIFNNKIFVNLYLYDASEVQMYYNIARRFKKIGWYRMNAVSGWFKGHFFDRKSRVKRFHYFTRVIRFLYDFFIYEDFRYVLRKDRKTVFKLKELHNKKTFNVIAKNVFFVFNKKLKRFKMGNVLNSSSGLWLSWEEIKPFRSPVRNMVFNTNHLSVKWWVDRYRSFYKKSIKKILKNERVYIKKRLKMTSKIKKFKFKKKKNSKMTKKRYFRKFSKRIVNKKMQKERELSNIKSFIKERRFSKSFLNKENLYFRFIKSNNRLLFTFLALLSKLFSTMTYSYDQKIFTRRWVRKVLRFYTYFFYKKFVIKKYGRIVEFVAGCLSLNFNVKIYILNNNSVGATFISRYIAICLRCKYDYWDMIIPLRKNLRKQMYVRKWSKFQLDHPYDYKEKIIEITAFVTTLRDIFFIRMQRINNFFKYKRKYKNKNKFTFLNFRLLKNLKYFKQMQTYKKLNNLNHLNLRNRKFNINLIQKIICKLSFFKINIFSSLIYRYIKLYLIKKKIQFIFYSPIWYRIFMFKFLREVLNKRMFFYYCSFFMFKINVKSNVKFLGLINLIWFLKTKLKVKEKFHLKNRIYFFIKGKYNFFYKMFFKYFNLYYNRLKRDNLNYYYNLKKKKIKYAFLCKRKRFSYKLKSIKNFRKRKLKRIYVSPFSKNKKGRKRYILFKYGRKLAFKKSLISSSYNINTFYNRINYCFYNRNYYFYTNTHNNFILNSFYNKNNSFSYLFYYEKNRHIFLIKNLKFLKNFVKNVKFFLKLKKKFLTYKSFQKLSRKIKNLYELFNIDKSILFSKIDNLKIPLQFNNKILIYPSQLINFSFINFYLVCKFFFKYLKKININLKYYNNKFVYLSKKKSLKKKKNELRYLNLFSIMRFYTKIKPLLKYFVKNDKIFNVNTLIYYNNKYLKKFFSYYKFKKITAFVTQDRTKDMFFYFFNDINNFYFKYKINWDVLRKKMAYANLYLSNNWNEPYRLPHIDEYEWDKKKMPIFLYNKTRRMKFFDDNRAILYGYKFHFVGRFTRKQQSANLWYRLGALANSSAVANVDYAIYTVILRYSICTVKVWLYKSAKAPKYKYRVF